MIIYYHGSPDKLPTAEHTIIVAPAGHLPGEFSGKEWMEMSGDKPTALQFHVKFIYGEAEVEDTLGKYMVANGLAMKSRLIVPNSWNR